MLGVDVLREVEMAEQVIDKILDEHAAWTGDSESGGHRTELMGIDLRDAELQGVDLRSANLERAALLNADLENALLGYADLTEADLRGANLTGTDLSGADLWRCNMKGCTIDAEVLHEVLSCRKPARRGSEK